nr:serpin family protein [Nocardia bovistercoris]
MRTCADGGRGHFPALAEDPLYVGSAVQDVCARFTSGGFEAAAVTAIGMARAAAPSQSRRIRCVEVTFDRPFGFLAVHRPTGLAIVAGWVATPPS